MPFLTIHIAGPGAQHNDNGHVSSSFQGHMWYSVSTTAGDPGRSFGFAPIAPGQPLGPGEPKFNDSAAYQSRAYTRTVEITQQQADRLISFGQDPSSEGFSTLYDGVNNSCIDYTWKGMQLIGINPMGHQGSVLPVQNIGSIDQALQNFTNQGNVTYVVSSNGSERTYSYSNGATYKENLNAGTPTDPKGYRVWNVPSPDGKKIITWTTTWKTNSQKSTTTVSELSVLSPQVVTSRRVVEVDATGVQRVTELSAEGQPAGPTESIETFNLFGEGASAGYSVTATTNNSTGVATYQLKDGAGNSVANGSNYSVAQNNTIVFNTGTSHQVYDLKTGRLVAQVDADGAGFVVGEGGNDTFYGAGQLNYNTNSGVLTATNNSGQVSEYLGTTNLVNVNTNTTGIVPSQAPIPEGNSAPNTDAATLGDYDSYDFGAASGNVNTDQGNAAVGWGITADGVQPGAHQVWDAFGNTPTDTGFDPSTAYGAGQIGSNINHDASGLLNVIPVDPLVLDLNGDGVKLTNYTDSPVLFDADNDGGSLEQTGWVSSQDGIVVHDLNGDGKINNISETLSEYYNGVAGTGGVAGTKPFADGFAALKSLDSNNNNQFTSTDAAWSSLRVWVDTNHDGKTDVGELKTFADLGITAIDLSPTSQSGEVRDGNVVLARGTFTQNWQTREAIAANFLANPAGSTITQANGGVIVATENIAGGAGGAGAVTSFVSQNIVSTVAETLNATTLGVRHLTGGAGNDTLTGDAQNNWLAGGLGADSLNGGAGDDVLLIDASDTGINGGDGLDIAQVIGNQGVTLNLSQSSIEIAVGGDGSDVFIGGGRSTVFVRGGAGDDLIIGGAANDVLSGEDGADLIDGGAGNDLIRGHRGQDQLLGGQGDDVLDGGLEDDTLSGGAGNDVLIGGRGDDNLNGGDGIDVAQYSGSYADYRFTKIKDAASGGTVFRVVDTRTGQDGADTLTNIEKLSFSDVSRVDLTLAAPLPAKDVLSVNSNGQALSRTVAHLLSKQQLLANDRDWDSDTSQLSITAVLEAKGGTVTLTAQGDVLFTPDASYTGVMSFKYKVQDAQGNYTQVTSSTGLTEPMKAAVYLQTIDLPTDPLAVEQWYLTDTKVIAAWGTAAEQAAGQGYSGKGVKIGQFEPGGPFSVGPEVFDYRHPDLAPNADKAWLHLPGVGGASTPQTFSGHATMVAGVMVAARNGEGGVGVAYNASLAGHYFPGAGVPTSQITQGIDNALGKFENYDVVNNSWGVTPNFGLNVVPVGALHSGISWALWEGRKELGTAIVMAGGNEREQGGNTNYNALTANRGVITVGSINAPSDLGTLQMGSKPFSNPGASILVSAPGSNIDSTSRELIADNGSTFGSDYNTSQGTSFAAPIVSGIIALMLEANPRLGYRDIQTILAMSATRVDDPNGTDWTYNTAKNWNGGGMHASHDYGFGKVDALAAVRLAETWHEQNTARNEKSKTAGSGTLNAAIPDGAGVLTQTLVMAAGLDVESAQVTLALNHQRWGDLIIKLISPTGTESILVNRPGKAPGSAATDLGDATSGTLSFSFNTTHVCGEASGGNWTLQVIDAATGNTGTLNNWKLDLYGSTPDNNDVYVYTNEFATTTGRMALTDGNGGSDVINASALTSNSVINLSNGATSTIAGKNLTINGDVESAYGGDGNDTLIGNAGSNILLGGRGNDTLSGGAGDDRLQGGRGNNSLTGDAGRDWFVVHKDAGSTVTITDFNPVETGEKIALIGFGGLAGFSQIVATQEGGNIRLNLGGGQSLLLLNVAPSQLSGQHFVFSSDDASLDAYLNYRGNEAFGNALPANNWEDLTAYAIDPKMAPYSPGTDNDVTIGGEGSDWLYGGSGTDYLVGGNGDDSLHMGGSLGVVDGDNFAFYGTTVGGAGADTFSFHSEWRGGAFGPTVSGTRVVASNLIADFDPNQAGERISLSSFKWITGFSDLTIETLNINGMPWTHISASSGAYSVNVSLRGVSGSQLNAGHFYFALPTSLSISGSAGNDTLTGDAGANTIDGLAGADSMTGRTGDDTYIVDNVGDTIHELPGGGYDSVLSEVSYTLGADVETLTLTGTGNLDATGNGLRNRLVGNTGNNRLDGGAEADDMVGGAGNDSYVVDDQLDTAYENAGEGTDTVESGVSWTLGSNFENLVLTGEGNINGTGNDLANVLTGNAGSNVLDGGQGADSMAGGVGNDTYYLDNTGDTISENLDAGIDTAYTGVNLVLTSNVENAVLFGTAVTLTGNSLDNTLLGNSLINTLWGAAGNDVLDGGAGADVMAGGTGNDVYFVDNADDAAVESMAEGIDTVVSNVNYILDANVEKLVLTGTVNLSGTGNALDNLLIGNSGNNTINGEAGNDLLDGGAGADVMAGGIGDDTYSVDNLDDLATEAVAEGVDTVKASVNYALNDNIENGVLVGAATVLTGNNLDNTLWGNALVNTLLGGIGNDTLDGDAGADHLWGGIGDDTYFVDNINDVIAENSAEGIDTVKSSVDYALADNVENLTLVAGSAVSALGNGGANVIAGNAGNNTLAGGAGSDAYVFGAGWGQDVIVESSAPIGDIDQIRFDASVLRDSISYERVSNDLVLRAVAGGSEINVQGWFAGENVTVESISFADGVVLGESQLRELAKSRPYINVPLADVESAEDVLWSYAIPADAFTDWNAGTVFTYTVSLSNGSDLPTWLSFDASTGTISGTPEQESVGNLSIRVTATGESGLSAFNDFTLTVLNVNDAPALVQPIVDQTVAEDALWSFVIPAGTFSDSDPGDILTLSASLADGAPLPAWVSFNAETGTFSGIPQNSDVGQLVLQVRATDAAGNFTSATFSLQVSNTNDAPVATSAALNFSAEAESGFSAELPAYVDVDVGDTVNIGVTLGNGQALPSWLVFNTAARTLQGTPPESAVGVIALRYFAIDESGASVSMPFELNVVTNLNPVTGTSNSDSLSGTAGADLIDGGAGNDSLYGNGGSDVYVFGRGYGQDNIYVPNSALGAITLRLLPGITPADVVMHRTYGSLLIQIVHTRDTISIPWTNNLQAIRAIEFADAAQTIWWNADILAHVSGPTEGADILFGTSGNDVINGLSGDDEISPGEGNDIVTGGAGNDLIKGSLGSDTYIFSRNSGNDYLYLDSWSPEVGTDWIQYLDVLPSEISITRNSFSHMLFTVTSTGSSVYASSINGHLATSNIKGIRFADGTEWTSAYIDQMLNTATVGNDFLWANSGGATVYGLAGNDNINGGSGNDVLAGGLGNDVLSGGGGNDTYVFGPGQGHDTISDSSGNSRIRIEGGLNPSQLLFTRSTTAPSELLISLSTNDKLQVTNWFEYSGVPLDWVIDFVNNGVVTQSLTSAQVQLLLPPIGAGDDVVVGTASNDTLSGLGGDDFLDGLGGNDTYLFGRNFGRDTVRDFSELHTLQFTADVAPADVELRRVQRGSDEHDENLEIGIKGTADAITFLYYFRNWQSNPLYLQIKFADGTIWGQAAINSLFNTPTSGNDHIVGTDGSDSLNGSAGNDFIWGGAGNDVLDGGAGNDTLSGGWGFDTMVLSPGSGHDVVANLFDFVADRVLISGYGPDDIRLRAVIRPDGPSQDLVIESLDGQDSVQIKNWFLYNNKMTIAFANGQVWDQSAMFLRLPTVGTQGEDTLIGGSTNDVLSGGAGNDMLMGGYGDDVMEGGAGSDVYDPGFAGWDLIREFDTNPGSIDTVKFNGYGPGNIVVTRDHNSLYLYGSGSAGSPWLVSYSPNQSRIELENWFLGDEYRIERVEFQGGTVWNAAVLESQIVAAPGTDWSDELHGGNGGETINAFAGDDQLFGHGGNDVLLGGAGNDALDGGAETDQLTGGTGNDLYLFGRGAGSDVLQENDATAGNTDVLQFLSDVTSDQIWLRQVSNDLQVSIIGTEDKVTLSNWYLGNQYHVEQFKTSDGKTLLDSQVQNLVQAMASFAPPAAGETTLSTSYQASLASVIAANWQ